jgi:hypothetical protein
VSKSARAQRTGTQAAGGLFFYLAIFLDGLTGGFTPRATTGNQTIWSKINAVFSGRKKFWFQ